MKQKEILDKKTAVHIVQNVINETKKAVIGKDEIIIKIILAILAKGHVLLEDIPGVGKTTLAMAFSKAFSLECNRVQFTPDVLPSDIVGFTILNSTTGKFEYKFGACNCNLFLADEINRTSSKTQSALLEIMEEGRVSVDGITRELPNPFFVIATQNPSGSAGTQLLPESQLDRFMVKLSMGYPDLESEINILKAKKDSNPLDDVQQVAKSEDIILLQNTVESVFVDDKIYNYVAKLIKETRNHEMIKLGVSPRGTIALMNITKAVALLKGRTYVIPDDVSFIFKDVVAHRLILSPQARISNTSARNVSVDILKRVPVPTISRV
ncbi:MAG: AAA family ATPase [Oscillospiraceae bacterium]